MKKTISLKTVSQIHQAILKSNHISEAENKLGVSVVLAAFLRKAADYKGFTLSFETLSTLSIEKAKELFGSDYDKPVILKQGSVSDYSLQEIHVLAMNDKDKSLSSLAFELGLGRDSLKRGLARYQYNCRALTFNLLKTISLEEAPTLFGDSYTVKFSKPRKASAPTWRQVHSMLADCRAIDDAVAALGVSISSLQISLSKFRYNGEKLRLIDLKTMSVGSAEQEVFKDFYDKPHTTGNKLNREVDLATMWQAILRKKTLTGAAGEIGIYPNYLTKRLKGLHVDGIKLTVQLIIDNPKLIDSPRFMLENCLKLEQYNDLQLAIYSPQAAREILKAAMSLFQLKREQIWIIETAPQSTLIIPTLNPAETHAILLKHFKRKEFLANDVEGIEESSFSPPVLETSEQQSVVPPFPAGSPDATAMFFSQAQVSPDGEAGAPDAVETESEFQTVRIGSFTLPVLELRRQYSPTFFSNPSPSERGEDPLAAEDPDAPLETQTNYSMMQLLADRYRSGHARVEGTCLIFSIDENLREPMYRALAETHTLALFNLTIIPQQETVILKLREPNDDDARDIFSCFGEVLTTSYMSQNEKTEREYEEPRASQPKRSAANNEDGKKKSRLEEESYLEEECIYDSLPRPF